MAKVLLSKAPGERVDYIWIPPLDEGDTITGIAQVGLVTGSAVLDSATVQPGNLNVKLWFTLGVDGETSEFLGQVTTVGGRTWQETFYLPVNSSAYGPLGSQLVQLWPTFKDVDPGTVDYWLTRAQTEAAWADNHGKMLYAAHNLSLSGHGKSAIPSGLSSFKSGTFSATVSDSIAGATGWDATVWGREFKSAMMRRGATPIMVQGGACV